MSFSALAQDSLAEAGEPGKQHYRFGYGHTEDPALRIDEGFLYVPFYQTEGLTLALGGKSRRLDFKDVPTGQAFPAPSSLEDREFSLHASYRQDENAVWGLNTNYGSASDRPFDGGDVSVFGVTLSHRSKTSETTQWIWFLNYSNNRVILNNVPLPGFAATFHNEEKTRGGMWGFPFVMLWARPTPKTFASAFLLFPAAARVQAGYLFWGPLQVNAKLEYGQQVYMIANRPRREDRLFVEGARGLLTLKAYLGAQTFFEVEAGRAFGRSLFQGRSSFERDSGNLDLPDENVIAASLQLSL
ncbi:MAG: hypothetical protein KF767_09745 [Bdellovibrionaceae bacterium]|nr:hypothetical protein [Pseudobdellovibrionaceae bacterium]